jgi:hypothetical protein
MGSCEHSNEHSNSIKVKNYLSALASVDCLTNTLYLGVGCNRMKFTVIFDGLVSIQMRGCIVCIVSNQFEDQN